VGGAHRGRGRMVVAAPISCITGGAPVTGLDKRRSR
jgi:hypothetical protein